MTFAKAETDRLIIRRFAETDLQDLYEYLSDQEVVSFEPYEAMDMDEVHKTLKERLESEEFVAIEEKRSGKVIGNIYIGESYCESVDLGYVLNKTYWGNGYAFEACQKVCEILFDNGVHRIEGNCDPLNISSWKLLERLGFLREGYLKKDIYFRKDENGKPIWKDTFIYSKLNPLG